MIYILNSSISEDDKTSDKPLFYSGSKDVLQNVIKEINDYVCFFKKSKTKTSDYIYSKEIRELTKELNNYKQAIKYLYLIDPTNPSISSYTKKSEEIVDKVSILQDEQKNNVLKMSSNRNGNLSDLSKKVIISALNLDSSYNFYPIKKDEDILYKISVFCDSLNISQLKSAEDIHSFLSNEEKNFIQFYSRTIALCAFLDFIFPNEIPTLDEVQKIVYLCQAAGAELGYHFEWGSVITGHYSSKLINDYNELISDPRVKKISKKLEINPFYKDILNRIKPIFIKPENFSPNTKEWIHLLSVYHYIRKISKLDDKYAKDLFDKTNPGLSVYIPEAARILSLFKFDYEN